MPKIVAIVGSPTPLSRTRKLVIEIQGQIVGQTGAKARLVDIAELVPNLMVRSREETSPVLEEALRAVEQADLLLIGTPVYKGSYTGLFKHFVDLIDYKSLAGVPVALLAMGGSDRHALVIDHQLRPLFGFFNAQTLPTGVFVSERSYPDGCINDPVLQNRISTFVRESVDAVKIRAAIRGLQAA
ncbi:NAD(P)H-dependent oxidoreductase [Microvirga sp. BT689]|uniref:NAD(P)H-dependent oxidoreductase n=1 Tax=Microvirga arvi TaxID=2778731 RepID=UPI00194F7CFF|nr:NAD(P)H-dependent oxidoreductase [Microvirga arvi]MBM6583813.1 NAD(P)H-dependent oxidoreductase [Microvirga arvi]